VWALLLVEGVVELSPQFVLQCETSHWLTF
jgi:hypothetical protein